MTTKEVAQICGVTKKTIYTIMLIKQMLYWKMEKQKIGQKKN